MKPIGRILTAVLLAACAGGGLSGCASVVIGAGATAATAAMEERGLQQAAVDTRIKVTINSLWLDHSEKMLATFSTNVSEGRVLVTGVTDDAKLRDEAIRLGWRVKGVREIINETRVVKGDGGDNLARDGWISGQLRGRLTLDQNVFAINYAIETVAGTVYLLGIAQNAAERDRVRDHARAIRYVRRVVSHVILKDDPQRPVNRDKGRKQDPKAAN